jgi:hypothetical protein
MEAKAIKPLNTKPQTRKQSEEPHMPIAYENELHRLIQISAYLLAEEDGFKQSPMRYWLMAEEKIDMGM